MNKSLVNEDERRLTLLKKKRGIIVVHKHLDFICYSDISSIIIMFLFCKISCLHDVCILYLYIDASASAGPKLF